MEMKVAITKKGAWTVYFGPEKIAPGATVVIQKAPEVLFRWNRLINKGDVDDLWIESFSIGSGALDQLRRSGPVSLRNFMYDPLDAERKGDTVQPSQSISLVIQNRGNAERTFAANLEGMATQ